MTPEVASFITKQTSPLGGTEELFSAVLARAVLRDLPLTRELVEDVIEQLKVARDFKPPHKVERTTAIFAAIDDGDEDAVKALLDEGIVEVEEVSMAHDGMTPLLLAASTGQLKIIRRLLAAGAKPQQPGQGQADPIDVLRRRLGRQSG
jgi:hypothetical protein